MPASICWRGFTVSWLFARGLRIGACRGAFQPVGLRDSVWAIKRRALDDGGFGCGFGQEVITGFESAPAGGQDLLDISALGITAGNFGANVLISAVGVDTLIDIGADSITLVGVGAGTVTQQDFILA